MRRNPNLVGWDGPSRPACYDNPCRDCIDTPGICEDGEQIDVDDFRDTLCERCEGSGVDPGPEPDWATRRRLRALKGRTAIKGSDPLTVLRQVRRERYADFPASMVRYGRVRAEAGSPVPLPDLKD